MAESMKDYETELEASFKKIEEGDILTGTVISVDEKEVVVDLKYYAEGIIPAEDYSREPGFSLKEQVNVGDEVSATVVSKDDGNGNILLSRTEAADVLAWDKHQIQNNQVKFFIQRTCQSGVSSVADFNFKSGKLQIILLQICNCLFIFYD